MCIRDSVVRYRKRPQGEIPEIENRGRRKGVSRRNPARRGIRERLYQDAVSYTHLCYNLS